MVFFLATLVTAAVFITDRMEGVWERTLVAGKGKHFHLENYRVQSFLVNHILGITTPELLLAHILTQSVIVFLQCTEVIFFIGVVFGTENNGDNLTVIILLSLTGFAGMLFGISKICSIKRKHLNKISNCLFRCRAFNFYLLRIAYNG